MVKSALICLTAVFALASLAAPPTVTPIVIEAFPHNPTSSTQGLLLHDGYLYESTGRVGHSRVMRVDISTGEAKQTVKISEYGEGLTLNGNQLVQLTWKAGIARVFNLKTFEHEDTFYYEGEGWGLCHDGDQYVMSNGSSMLTFRDREFETMRTQRVTFNGRPLRNLNELECVGDHIYANVYGETYVYKIDKVSGVTQVRYDFAAMAARHHKIWKSVLNGIAHDPDTNRFYVTGKLWDQLYLVELPQP